MPTFDSVLVTGNQTINQNLQVDGNETVGGMLQVENNQTVMGSMQVVGDQTVAGNLATGGFFLANSDALVLGSVDVGNTVNAASTVNAIFRLMSSSQSTTPAGGFSAQQVRYYSAVMAGQPGLVLKGTDGNDYVLFVDVSGGVPNLGIMKA
ncbi:hypothetical protein GRF59_22450 [Paenibacillus sp. HJL G12]|uniref:Uncharacterized protein n=1 Tax=Paenibacillus dendrobii TaxID=2691084 RepID=A0A7X3LKD5_9BACL|nr:hypothetical protein [Paenibacillus dendrobii]MWV46369.1 hypothetical protein [Paenibacillus dendrobii]